jgi:hypothetical protein
MNGASGIPSHNMKKIRVPNKDDVVGVFGHKGTFQVLSVDSRNRIVDLRSLEKGHVPAEVFGGGSLDIALVSATTKEIFEQVARFPRRLQSTMTRIRRTP